MKILAIDDQQLVLLPLEKRLKEEESRLNNISNTVANLSWTSGSVNDSLWHVYLVPDTIPGTSIVPDSSHLIVSTNDTLSLTGLNPSSDYLVYVRTMCSATDSSILSSPLSFSTYPDCPNPGILSLSNKTLKLEASPTPALSISRLRRV